MILQALIISTCLLAAPAGPAKTIKTVKKSATTYAYVCSSANSKKYHANPKCYALKNCNGTVQKVSMATIRKEKKTACKICHSKKK